MSTMRTTRFALITAGLAAGLLLAGCATPGTSGNDEDTTPSTQPQQQNALADFDPCQALSPEQIRSFGASPEGEPYDKVGEVGCDYVGEELNFGVLKNPEADEQYWQERRNNFDKRTPNTVGSHEGFAGIAAGGTGTGTCRQMMYAGQGSAIVDVTYQADKIQGVDPCATAKKIAEQVEPKLPAAQ